MKKLIEGNCALCDKFRKLSFEHVPPQSAFNNKAIFIQNYEHLIEKKSNVYGKRNISHRGFGGYTLCEDCNKKTGSWYAKDFGNFAHQGMEIIKKLEKPQYAIKGDYTIKPLNTIKQILTMFMSADKCGHLKSQQDLVSFILNKEAIGIPNKYRVYLYSTLSSKKRMIGYSLVFKGNKGIQKWSEINFQPFGYLLTEESEPAHKDMCDITSFGMANYDELVSVEITTPFLNIQTPDIGTYVPPRFK